MTFILWYLIYWHHVNFHLLESLFAALLIDLFISLFAMQRCCWSEMLKCLVTMSVWNLHHGRCVMLLLTFVLLVLYWNRLNRFWTIQWCLPYYKLHYVTMLALFWLLLKPAWTTHEYQSWLLHFAVYCVVHKYATFWQAWSVNGIECATKTKY